MKKAIKKTVSLLKGVSTLDVMIRNSRIILLLLLSVMALIGTVRGGHSTLDVVDPSFNPQIRTSALESKSVDQIIPLPDGKILVSGRFNTYNGQPVGGLVRLNADGTLDTTFNSILPSASVAHMDVQGDGKILVLKQDGYPATYNIIRLNTNGTVDGTFNFSTAGMTTFSPSTFAIDASGRIIVIGNFFDNNGRSIFRLNADGSFDTTFQVPFANSINSLTTQNNKIIISSWELGTLRLNENGSIDSSFISRNFIGLNMIVQPDGKILILSSSLSNFQRADLIRLNENGSYDPEFISTNLLNLKNAMALSNDGKITLAIPTGNTSLDPYHIKRFLPDGTADSTFTPYTSVSFNCLAVQADGDVLMGDFSGYPFSNDFVRLLPNGSPDPTFTTGLGFQTMSPGRVQAIDVQTDGKILLGGDFALVNDVPRDKIVRVNADSTLDPSFQINTSSTGNYFSVINDFSNIRTQSDGKIVASGSFYYFINGERKSNLVRLNSDGSIDPSFILGFEANFLSIETFNDGKLLAGNSRNGSDDNYPIPLKITATGERDASFNASVYPQEIVYIYDVAIQPDGRVLIAGRHDRTLPDTSSIIKSFVTRLNADGSLDTTFQTREQLDKAVRAFVLLPNGQIVVSEAPAFWFNPSQSNVLRLNPDGTVDPTFNTGTGANGTVNTMLLLSTGRIFVGGQFSNFNGQPRGNLVQLNEDGSVFTPVYNLNGEVLSLAVDSNTGRVFVGGTFTTIFADNSGGTRTYVAGLIDAPASSTRFDFDGDGRADLATFSAADGRWSILNSSNGQTVSRNFGLSGDKTVAADFDGDGKTDIAVFRPADGTWWYLNLSTNTVRAVQWGINGDKPVTGDFDGDGRADFAVWRPSSAVWWILKSSNGSATVVKFGLPGDIPLSHADFDGDRQTDIAVWRPSDGNFYWLASGSGNQFNAVHFGTNGDIPAVADYNGDGKTDLVVYRPSEGNWYQYLTAPNGEYTFTVINFGMEGDVPVPADYDGDGKTDIAVRRGNEWHILHTALGYSAQIFGNADAQAVAAYSNQ